MLKENIKLKEQLYTWYVIDEQLYLGKKYYLLENEVLGDELPCIITDSNLNIVIANVYNGFYDLEEKFSF